MFYGSSPMGTLVTYPVRTERRKGRGASGNVPVRFESTHYEVADDGWSFDAELPPLRTEVSVETPRTAITRNSSPDIGFERSINPYRGCEHGCVYCYARPTHAFIGLSPGLDFETRLIARPELPDLLVRELSARRYRPKVIAMGTNTDPYQPIEREFGVTRRVLRTLLEFRHPVGIVTKGTLIERDLDILGELGRAGLARVGISITTLDPDVARKMEPRAPAPARRLRTIERLTGSGCPVRVMVSPIVPGLTDHEMEGIMTEARDAGAVAAGYVMLRLPLEVAELFRTWLEERFPERAVRVMNRVRETRGGRDYDPDWGKRMTGTGVLADMIARRFRLASSRLGLPRELAPLRTDLFRVPVRSGEQMSLF